MKKTVFAYNIFCSQLVSKSEAKQALCCFGAPCSVRPSNGPLFWHYLNTFAKRPSLALPSQLVQCGHYGQDPTICPCGQCINLCALNINETQHICFNTFCPCNDGQKSNNSVFTGFWIKLCKEITINPYPSRPIRVLEYKSKELFLNKLLGGENSFKNKTTE